MDDDCENDDCTDLAEWLLKLEGPGGQVNEHKLCTEHMRARAAEVKAAGITVLGLSPIDEADEDEDEDDGDNE